MIEHITPSKVQHVVKRGFERMSIYRRARAMFVKEYVGQYYSKHYGMTGDRPINMVFSAIRAIVPAIVSKNPVNEVSTAHLAYKEFAELQSMGLDTIQRRLKLKEILRAWVVSAMFSMGIVKTGIAAAGNCILIDDQLIDPGEIFVSLVDLDDFVIDPLCKSLSESSFLGDKTSIPRQFLLDYDLYDHDLVNKLPSSTMTQGGEKATAELSTQFNGVFDMKDLQDMVNVVELWVPGANALVTMPDPREIIFDKYIGMTDYYGPKKGPYRFLSFTPPVDSNPLPIAPVSLYYDLARAVNRTMVKTLDQSDSQRNIMLYKPSHADVAQDILDADNNEAVATDNPEAVRVVSFDGQAQSNVQMLQQLQVWFNYMSGNPDQISGQNSEAETATQANILQGNAMISIEDARDILYDGAAGISEDCAWYMRYDPLLDITVARRKPGMELEEVNITPEQVKGEPENFVYKIRPKSMSKLDPAVRSKRLMEFLTNALPALTNTAMMMMQLGIPFNLQKVITITSNEFEIGDDMQEIFIDPEFQQKLETYLIMKSAGGGGGAGAGSTGSTRKAGPQAGIAQNGGYPSQTSIPSSQADTRSAAQGGADLGQQAGQGVY